MDSRKKNQILVTLFLFSVIAFTGIMTFYAGPVMMAKRNEVAQDKILFKCQKVLSGSRIDVQMRGWERPNPHPVFPVTFSGITAPPPEEPDHPEVIAWAETHGFSPETASEFGISARKTLLAFIRKQNLFLYREDGSRGSDDLLPDSRVHVFVSGTHVNLKLLKSGLALHDSSRPHAYSEVYAEAEAGARSGRKGIWAAGAPASPQGSGRAL